MYRITVTHKNGSVLSNDFTTEQECQDWLDMESEKAHSALGVFAKEFIVEPHIEAYPEGSTYIEDIFVDVYIKDTEGNPIEAVDSTEEVPIYQTQEELRHKVAIPSEFSYKIVDITEEDRKNRISAQISKMIDFGKRLIVDFSTENSILGIRSDGMTRTIRKNSQEITNALSVGDLLGAIEEIQELESSKKDDKYITDVRLDEYIDRITSFLSTL